jgi:hypothetical protein
MPDPDRKPGLVPLESVAPEMDAAQLAELSGLLAAKPRPLPSEALALLHGTAAGDTGGSVAARTFLFWLVGRDDPAGLGTDGALELRRLDARHREAALAVLTWWTGPTRSDQPVYDILEDLARRFTALEAAQNDR